MVKLDEAELAALRRFDECAQDGEGYDVPKEMMQRLAEIGVVRRQFGANYIATKFGMAVLSGEAAKPEASWTSAEAKRYRFLLSFLLDRGVLHRYHNGVWRLRGIYGVDDSGLKGAGRTPEEALDNAIIAVNLDRASAESFWSESCEAVLSQPSSSSGSHEAKPASDNERDAARYRWLRDKSEPGICSFYLSVGQAYKGVKFAPETVDAAIDVAILTNATVS